MPSDSEPRFPSVTTLVMSARAASTGERSLGVLTVVGGLETGRVLAIRQGVDATLGRSEGCSFRFDDASVSGVHARVACMALEHVFADAGSTNGSYVNDAKVSSPVKLKDGDRIQLGSTTFLRFSLVSEDEEAALRKMYDAALRDGLTGVFNRKHLEERIDAEIAYAQRNQTELSLVIFDVDHFKKVNDTYGHLAGDAVLKSVAEVLAGGLRAEDVLGRYGGEEFVVVVRGVSVSGAELLANRLRESLGSTSLRIGAPGAFGAKALAVTASAGVSSLACAQARYGHGPEGHGQRGQGLLGHGPSGQGRSDKTALFAIADARLYVAKQAGRNRVVGAG